MFILLVQESESTDFVLLEPRIFIFQFSLPASGGLSPVSELCRILRFCPHRKQSLPQEKLESKWPSHMDKYTSQCTGVPAGTLPSLGGVWLCWASPLGRLYENILVHSFLPPHLYLFLASYFLNFFFRDMLIKSTDFLPSLTLHTLIYSKQAPAHTWRLSAHPTHHDTLQRLFVSMSWSYISIQGPVLFWLCVCPSLWNSGSSRQTSILFLPVPQQSLTQFTQLRSQDGRRKRGSSAPRKYVYIYCGGHSTEVCGWGMQQGCYLLWQPARVLLAAPTVKSATVMVPRSGTWIRPSDRRTLQSFAYTLGVLVLFGRDGADTRTTAGSSLGGGASILNWRNLRLMKDME